MKNPKIRFKGFTEVWEQRKLESVASFSKGNGYTKSDLRSTGTPIILYGRLYTKYETSISEVDTFVDVKNGSVFSKGGEVIIPASGETSEDIARAATVVNAGVLLGGDLNIITPDSSVNSVFLALSISNGNPQKELAKKAQGKSVVHIHNEEIKDLTISFPKLVEQKRISAYFANLDNLITLHQRKCDETKILKKYMLQKMFPQNGSNVPEIRFAGFTNAWEQRKLGELADIVGGGTPSTSKEAYWDGNIDWYAPAEITNQIFVDSSERKITQEGFNSSSAKMLPVGTVLFTSRAGIGKMAILRKESCTNQGFQSIVPVINKLDSYFIYSRADELKRYGETVGAGSTFVEVSGKQMAAMELMMPPTMKEQQKIGEYFTNLDNLITLHQRKCDELKEIKKSMLQNMFA